MTVRPDLNAAPRTAVNHAPLTPVSFLARTAEVHPERVAVRYGALTRSYEELRARCARLASALERRGVGPGDCVAVMAPNIPALLEAHFGVPQCGARAECDQHPPGPRDD